MTHDPAHSFAVLLASVVAAGLMAWLVFSAVAGLLRNALRPWHLARDRRRDAARITALVRYEYEAVTTSPDRRDEVPVLDDPGHLATRRFRAALARVALLEAGHGDDLDEVEAAVGELAASWQSLQDHEQVRLPGRRGQVRAELLRYRINTHEPTCRARRPGFTDL